MSVVGEQFRRFQDRGLVETRDKNNYKRKFKHKQYVRGAHKMATVEEREEHAAYTAPTR